ncbi:enoyl-ACP reductase FabV [Pediococcus claussenii]|uniref:trans-2-enoyl-CoA reductase (NAD(+)) n=1 Tax=Pediococcus claussenii (strain ATCC BAA-344 / DSM 14800 / JCM 18046 / KCTC 3811 / LMG 21948 / P06) TaxID=701521 RepID=G8PEI0_PEDCP|nr:enoyl-ACP reductase FabV [Pediococcus claussenii]AEV95589.1 trans-2-enoyl-CoA reductase catalytic region family protein [Pediococcus claussenii ATCC BAA-344]ANZ69110.1 trans-2-enoyl-CoA reductase [Pediococcus claussenii]ANZ70927.1 trans-2-enoyl-CoA reductase [Pediococcus claussenii]KRN20178.1 hypothetical protein IV79_GL000844 [Pediococcus claussenii]
MTQLITTQPILKGNIARSINPNGLKKYIRNQIEYVESKGEYNGPKKVLVLGASSSYGLAARITTAFGGGADTIGVSFERGPKNGNMLGSAGWYNNIYFRQFAEQHGLIATNFIGDAFSDQMKDDVINYIKTSFGGKIDLLVYSLASPKRIDPANPEKIYTSVIKPIDKAVTGYNLNLEKNEMVEQTIEPANQSEIDQTIKVMGGEDWERWIDFLKKADVLVDGFKTVIFSYIGSPLTYSFYHEGTLGVAKDDDDIHAKAIQSKLESLNGKATVIVNKAVTTKASLVIPIFPVYCIALYKVMTAKGTHETPIMHQDRTFRTMLYGKQPKWDEKGRLRPDSWELESDTQAQTKDLLQKITPDNFKTDLTAYRTFKTEFMNLNGFEVNDSISDQVDFDELVQLKP